MSDTSQVAIPGSTLGEAVGALGEKEVNRLMLPTAEEYGCMCVTAGKWNATRRMNSSAWHDKQQVARSCTV